MWLLCTEMYCFACIFENAEHMNQWDYASQVPKVKPKHRFHLVCGKENILRSSPSTQIYIYIYNIYKLNP